MVDAVVAEFVSYQIDLIGVRVYTLHWSMVHFYEVSNVCMGI